LLPNDIKQKFATGLSSDLFSQIDPLGVQDGLINTEEFTAALSPKSNMNTGNGLRGDSGFNTTNSGYAVNGAGGNYNATQTAQNIIGDFENLLNGTKGSIINGNINKGELETVISTYRGAGLNDRANHSSHHSGFEG